MSAVPDEENHLGPDRETHPGYRRWDCTGDDPEVLARAADDARAT